jgi:hypothetical protein
MNKKLSDSERFGFQPDKGSGKSAESTIDQTSHEWRGSGLGENDKDERSAIQSAILSTWGWARSLANRGHSDGVSFQSFTEYLAYLFESTKADAFVDGKFPGTRIPRHSDPIIDAALLRFWNKIIKDLEGIGELSTLPPVHAIREYLQIFTRADNIKALLMQYLNVAVTDILDDHEKSLKRAYRKRAELPDPTKPANAPVNLRRKQVALRFLPELTEAIDTALQRAGGDKTRNDWVTEAVEEKLLRDHPDLLNKPQEPDEAKPAPKK